MSEATGGVLKRLFDERLPRLGIRSHAELGRILARGKGVTVSENTLSAWYTGAKRPRPGRLALLLDVLDVHGPDRAAVYQAVAEEALDLEDDDPQLAAPAEVA